MLVAWLAVFLAPGNKSMSVCGAEQLGTVCCGMGEPWLLPAAPWPAPGTSRALLLGLEVSFRPGLYTFVPSSWMEVTIFQSCHGLCLSEKLVWKFDGILIMMEERAGTVWGRVYFFVFWENEVWKAPWLMKRVQGNFWSALHPALEVTHTFWACFPDCTVKFRGFSLKWYWA